MGNLCYKNMKEPTKGNIEHPIQNTKTNSTNSTQPNEYQKETKSHYRQYKENNVAESMKQKKINTKKLCRPSRVIHEQQSLNNNINTEQIQNSYYSGYYEAGDACQNQDALISMFVNSHLIGQKVKLGDMVILRNLKDHFHLFCKYQKLKKYDKQNLVKLEKSRDDENEMYLTWKFKGIHPQKNYSHQQPLEEEYSPDSESIDMGDQEIENNQCVKIQHVMTSCYLQSNKNYRHGATSKFHHGQLVSGGPHNRITTHQQWTLQILQPFSQQQIHINTLFKIKHTESNTYLTSVQQDVCCINMEDFKDLEEQKEESEQESKENSNIIYQEEEKNTPQQETTQEKEDLNNTDSANPSDTIDQTALTNDNDQTPRIREDQSRQLNTYALQKRESKERIENCTNLNQILIENQQKRSERCSIDSLFKKPTQKLNLDSMNGSQQGYNTIIDVNTKSNDQLEIANMINDDPMSENGDALFKLEQQKFLNDQINNEYFKLNQYSQQIAIQEKERMDKKKEQFLQLIQNGDIWYISEVIPH